MRERQKRLAPRSRRQQGAIDHNHLLLHQNNRRQLTAIHNKKRENLPFECSGPTESRTRSSTNPRTPTQCRLLFAATCCLLALLPLVISSDFPRGAADPINQGSRATSIKDKNVIKSTAPTAAFNGATSQLANDKQRQPPTRATTAASVESSGHRKRATTTINQEQRFGAHKTPQRQQQSKRSDRLEVAPRTARQLFKYHLNHSRPPPLVPITIQQQQQPLQTGKGNSLVAVAPMTTRAGGGAPNGLSGAETKTITNRTRTAANNRAGTGGDLLMAASEPDGQGQLAANAMQQLAQLQLPLELHLKLKPLPLPMPPPPTVRQQTTDSSKVRRSLVDADEFGSSGRAQPAPATVATTQSIATTTTPATTTTRGGHVMSNRHSLPGDLQALTWQEAKRVLLMNSIVPPLVQAAQRRIERRHLLNDRVREQPPSITNSEQPLGHPLNHLLSDLSVQQVADNSLHAPTAGQPLKFQEFFPPPSSGVTPTTTTPPPVYTTTLATPQKPATTSPLAAHNSGALIGLSRSGLVASLQQQQQQQREDGQQQQNQGQHHQQARLSSTHRIELNAAEFLNASAHQRNSHTRNVAPVTFPSSAATPPTTTTTTTSEHEWRIQQMAAAMLPFVWPSFQLTTGHAHLGAAKLRARSSGESSKRQEQQQVAVRTTTITTTRSPAVMAPTWPMKYQQLDRTSSGPVAASEFKPTFIDQDQERDSQVVVGLITTTTTTTTTTSTTARPTTTTTSWRELTGPRQQQDARSARKRRRKSGYLQQQQERLERQNYQLQLNKKAKKVATSKPELVKESAGTERASLTTATPPASTDGPVTTHSSGPDSTRLASRYQMPRIKFNSNRTTTATLSGGVRRSEQATDERRARGGNPGVEARQDTGASKQQLVTQLPKTLSKLIEQQLAAAAGSSNSTLRQNLLLLQQYFSQNQTQTLPSKAPTTSVSRVVRLHGAPASGDLLRVPPPSNQSELVGSTNTMATSTTTTTTTTVAPTPVANVTKTLPETETETEASVERDRKTLEPPTTTTTATTTTTTERPTSSTQRSQVDSAASLEIGSNRISSDLSEVDDAAATTTTTVKPAQINNNSGQQQQLVADSARPRQQPPVQEQRHQSQWQKSNRASAAHSARNNKNIKLFHFKRKPDVAKLPFYKKPLNYTELGWTPEEIEREQRRLAELQQLELSASGDNRSESGDSDDGDDEGSEGDRHSPSAAATTRAPKAATGPLTIGQSGDLSLLKRKRRAKNQFERLMAELQAAAAQAANGTSTSTTTELPALASLAAGGRSSGQPAASRDGEDDDDDDDKDEEEEEAGAREVPAVRKKSESLVMKPMFFGMNQQKRRRASQASGNQTHASESTTSANETTTSQEVLASSRSKPIVRLRRKHHGEQPEVIGPRPFNLELEPRAVMGQSPWRPSGLAGWSAPVVGHQHDHQARLLIVPSGLLTPSGSHPMPLFAPTANSATMHQAAVSVIGSPAPTATWHEQQASAPASQPTVSSATQAAETTTTSQNVHSNSPQVASLIQQQQHQAPGANSDLRVPKLLVKPMRPAKYSLNGYIPKPSLVNQMQQHQAPLSHPPQTPAMSLMQAAGGFQAKSQLLGRPAKQSPALVRSTAQQKQQQKHQLALASGRQPATQQNKDLDSSTSNEIFSRRRGLQKAKSSAAQPRSSSSSSSSGISFEALLARSSQPEAAAASATLSDPLDGELPVPLPPPPPSRNQMEENRRKYVRQHQQTLKSIAPMSAQRANQIKAKLGLVASPNSIRPKRPVAAETTSGDMIELAGGDSSQTEVVQQSKPLAGSGQRRKWSTPAESSASTSSISTLEPPDAALELAIAGGGQQLTAGSGAYHTIPKTDFECTNKRGHFVAGLFADFKTGCRVWHLCSNNRKYSFLCPTGTIFNAKVRICDWRYNVKCENEPPQ